MVITLITWALTCLLQLASKFPFKIICGYRLGSHTDLPAAKMIGQLISILEAGYPAFLEVLETFDYALGKAILFGWFGVLILDSHILTCTSHDSYFSLMSCKDYEKWAGIPRPRRVRCLLPPGQFNCIQMHVSHLLPFYYSQTGPLELFPQQFLCLLVHAGQLLGDGVL